MSGIGSPPPEGMPDFLAPDDAEWQPESVPPPPRRPGPAQQWPTVPPQPPLAPLPANPAVPDVPPVSPIPAQTGWAPPSGEPAPSSGRLALGLAAMTGVLAVGIGLVAVVNALWALLLLLVLFGAVMTYRWVSGAPERGRLPAALIVAAGTIVAWFAQMARQWWEFGDGLPFDARVELTRTLTFDPAYWGDHWFTLFFMGIVAASVIWGWVVRSPSLRRSGGPF